MSRLVCQSTKATYSLNDPRWRSESGGLLDIEYDFTFDLLAIQKRAPTLWRYREAIPIERDENIVSFNEGFTPLVPVDIDGREIHLKLDYLFPTASFKDRGATVLISKVKELGIDRVLIDSPATRDAPSRPTAHARVSPAMSMSPRTPPRRRSRR